MNNSNTFYKKHRDLKNEVIAEIRKIIGKKKITFFGDSFKDEANNELTAIDKNVVYFDGTMESYPLEELGITDAIQILSILEG